MHSLLLVLWIVSFINRQLNSRVLHYYLLCSCTINPFNIKWRIVDSENSRSENVLPLI